MIELWKLDGCRLSVLGDYHEMILCCAADVLPAVTASLEGIEVEKVTSSSCGNKGLVDVKTLKPLEEQTVSALERMPGVERVIRLEPILPTTSRADCTVPFHTAEEMLAYAKGKDLEMWQLAVLYESQRGGTTEEEVEKKMDALADIMENAVSEGLRGTVYEGRILGPQAHLMDHPPKNRLFPAELTRGRRAFPPPGGAVRRKYTG